MIRIEAETLEDAFGKASRELGCSITELKYEIVQNPSKGFLGLFKKTAIIVVQSNVKIVEVEKVDKVEMKIDSSTVTQQLKTEKKQETKSIKFVEKSNEKVQKDVRAETENVTSVVTTANIQENIQSTKKPSLEYNFNDYDFVNSIVDTATKDEVTYQDVRLAHNEKTILEIKNTIDNLFKISCFKLNPVEILLCDNNTLFIKFTGDDSALLIGKDGYRYKALSYMLFNWINPKYGYLLKLEIAEFLKNLEISVKQYLEPIKDEIRANGKAQTKTLDGVLVQIALKELRDEFKDKYIVTKDGSDGNKYIIISEFIRKNE
jgi:spoIIIJ-associated protein